MFSAVSQRSADPSRGRPGRGKSQVVAPSVQIDAGHPVPIPFGHGRQGDGRAPKVFLKARAAFAGAGVFAVIREIIDAIGRFVASDASDIHPGHVHALVCIVISWRFRFPGFPAPGNWPRRRFPPGQALRSRPNRWLLWPASVRKPMFYIAKARNRFALSLKLQTTTDVIIN